MQVSSVRVRVYLLLVAHVMMLVFAGLRHVTVSETGRYEGDVAPAKSAKRRRKTEIQPLFDPVPD